MRQGADVTKHTCVYANNTDILPIMQLEHGPVATAPATESHHRPPNITRLESGLLLPTIRQLIRTARRFV